MDEIFLHFMFQTILFLNESTLLGAKLKVYVLIKILKFCTGSTAKSYHCKYAVSEVLGNRRNLSSKKLGSVLKEVLDHHTLRGKFCSVHPGLVQEGVDRVEVGVEGLHFICKSGLPLISVFTTFQMRFLSKVSFKQGT